MSVELLTIADLLKFGTTFCNIPVGLRVVFYAKSLELKWPRTHRVFTDSTQCPKFVILTPNPDFCPTFNDVCIIPLEYLQHRSRQYDWSEMFNFLEAIPFDWTSSYSMSTLVSDVWPHFQQFIAGMGSKAYLSTGLCKYYMPTTNMKDRSTLKDNFIIDKIQEDELLDILSKWKFRNRRLNLIDRMKQQLKTYPNLCVRRVDSGQIVCYCLTSYFGTLSSLLTDEEYRQHGFAKALTSELTRQVENQFGGVAACTHDNPLGDSFFIKHGWKYCLDVVWPYINPPETVEVESGE